MSVIDNKCAIYDNSAMAQMNISIPEKLKAWAEARVSDGEFASTSDYVRDLVRQDQRRMRAVEHLRAEIQAGRDSGVSERNVEQIIEDTKRMREPRAAA